MFICIDGTGPYGPETYAEMMKNSFCKQITNQLGRGKSIYIEGPGGAGLTTVRKSNMAYRMVHNYYDTLIGTQKHEPLYLAGYSRGGAAVLQLAKFLNEDESPLIIKGMFLFDPVNRDVNMNTDGLGTPQNVRNLYVIYRDTTIEHVNTWGVPLVGNFDRDIYARKWMGRCFVDPQDSRNTKWQMKTVIFGASHGALGGSPWLQRAADKKATADAATEMNKAFRMEELGITLEEKSFPKVNKTTYMVR